MTEAEIRAALASTRCWDARTEAAFAAHGEALDDCILQCREELVALCRFIDAAQIRSYLEIGVWTGRLVSTLHRIFRFDRVAACDHRWAAQLGLPVQVPEDAAFLDADSDSAAFLAWRAALGPVDLVFIDANHSYRAVKRDFEINRRFPHRFLALHDITGSSRATVGVKKFWEELDIGYKLEIKIPNQEINATAPTMGIGIWSLSEAPAAWLSAGGSGP